MAAHRLVSLDAIFSSRFSPWFSGQIWTCVGAVVRGRWLLTAGARGHPSRDRDGSIRDGGASCRCCLRLSMLIVCVFASTAFAGGFQRSGRLQEMLRRNDGSSESVARTGVLMDSTGQENVVVLYISLHLRLLGPRKTRPARASPPRPRARESCSSHTTLAYAHTKGPNTGGKGGYDDCGEGHMAISGQPSKQATVWRALASSFTRLWEPPAARANCAPAIPPHPAQDS